MSQVYTSVDKYIEEVVTDSVKELIFLAFEEDYIHHYEPIKLKGDN